MGRGPPNAESEMKREAAAAALHFSRKTLSPSHKGARGELSAKSSPGFYRNVVPAIENNSWSLHFTFNHSEVWPKSDSYFLLANLLT